ncbi:hypothetical protein OG604_47310 [Streptomyces sp. NBC_01231]|nr:hypothetical protein OG604_47310 [Streptomyces sp. NBC_01231]
MVTAAQPATTSTFSPLTTWDGWQQFVDTPHAPARDADDQEWTLEQREDYHARFVVPKTPAMDTISTAVRRLLLLNRGQQAGARRGLIISGPATTGTTTAMQQLGRTVELADRRRHPNQDGRLPVLFITVPPSSTPKMLISEFARFLGLPMARPAARRARAVAPVTPVRRAAVRASPPPTPPRTSRSPRRPTHTTRSGTS